MDSLRVTTNPNYNTRLRPILSKNDIPSRWHGTPIDALISAHNFDTPIESTGKPELLIATCIEFRFQPRVPAFYAYEIRRASGRVIGAEFTVTYALAKGVKHVALIGHNDCGMTQVAPNAELMIDTLVAQEWPRAEAEHYVKSRGPRHAITDEVDALRDEYQRLRRLFRHVEIAPLFAALGNDKLYMPLWYYEIADKTDTDLGPVQKEDVLGLP
jgi:carbonic anhydrase